MKSLKLTTKLALINTIATVVLVSLVLGVTYLYFYKMAMRPVLEDFSNPGRFVTVISTPFGKQYIVLRWDVYVADLEEKAVINDPFGIGLINEVGLKKIENRYFYMTSVQSLIIGKEITPVIRFLENIRKLFVIAILFLALGVTILSYFLTRKNVRELKEFISQIESLGGSDVTKRVDITPKTYELKELVQKFNELMERIERSYKAQESFVSAVSHELRTPVATLLGYVNMLKRWGLRDENVLRESVEAIEESSREIKQIIENMLLIARVENLTQENIELREFCEDLINQKFKNRNSEPVDIEVQGEGIMRTNKEGLGIIFTILLDNALTHGAPPYLIDIKNNQIAVVNHGEKIPEELIPKIFERFFKGEKSNGTGLGLYIANEIAKKLSLEIKVESTEEKTVFKIVKN
ncbi:Signal transduction histidine kinase [Fervidobacterium changbaicum]|uniref:histidine kinase n=1 Tax=Fervidobacterium changbaicum TaxID=310769 RepID=A0ABX5QQH6_9BACT|nr:histidine kinase dimerization/phospho-acceptor domain-containing protein [Fervidobacterium changbaicum]QAV32714.1 HAMP domain-containing protein [Fervidobacterium changbaicum]SDG98327.1 Signal transduction histidine kinase [Fervidobacterium changbaicum]